MKVGDIVINPYIQEKTKDNKINTHYRMMIIHIGPTYTECLYYNGAMGRYYTKDIEEFEVIEHMDIEDLIIGE